MAQPFIPDCCQASASGFTSEQLFRALYCLVYSINQNTGGSPTNDQYISFPITATSSGSIPAGVLGWSITAVSGTVAVNGHALAVGGTFSGGGYNGKVSTSAITYTITAGSALIEYDVPA